MATTLADYRPGMYKNRVRLTAAQVMQVAINSGASLMAKVPNNRGGEDASAVVAVATAYAENTLFAPRRTHRNNNGTIDTGLWMINSVHRKTYPDWTSKNLKDPDFNARAAATLSGGFTSMPPDVWFAIKTRRYDRGLEIARRAAKKIWEGFDPSRLGVVEDITNVPGAAKFAADAAGHVVTGWVKDLAEALWPILLKTALAGTGLALIGYGVKGLFTSTAAETTQKVAPVATGVAKEAMS